MNQQIIFPTAVVPAIIGLTHIARNIGLPDRFSPLLALALGVAAAVGQALTDGSPIVPAVIYGVVLGALRLRAVCHHQEAA